MLSSPSRLTRRFSSGSVTFSSTSSGPAPVKPVTRPAFLISRAVQFITLAARDRIPATYPIRDFVAAGGLMSYGTDLPNALHQVGVYTAKILKGAKPADLPTLQSTRFEFVINIQTAHALGIDVPPGLLAIADEVVE